MKIGRAELACWFIRALGLTGFAARFAVGAPSTPSAIVTANNPDPQNLPTLAVWEDTHFGGGQKLTMVSAQFPNVPDFVCDSWCYESAVDFLDARALENGRLELRHRVRDHTNTDSATSMAQAWHDCLHNNPQWQPADAPPGERTWRLKIYAMAADPQALLARFANDFPNAKQPRAVGFADTSASPTDSATRTFQSPGVVKNLPAFHERVTGRMDFPLSWLHAGQTDFESWRRQARAKVMECLLVPPPATSFAPVVIAERDRGSYVARRLVFNLTGDSRVLAYLLVPKSTGPHPAALLLHDHGAKFDIGKEKVIEPFDDKPEKLESARKWVEKYYGNRFIGDEIAKRGYVCLATDMLNWSDRGGGGYDGQEKLAANLLQLGTSFAGLIAHEDLRAAEFLAAQSEVDSKQIAAIGLSVGGFRTWQLAALSDHIAAGVSVCWMATRKGLLVPGNNQTTGQSAFTMTHPGLATFLDYPDVASLACPKPMMFCCGRRDALFPVASTEEAFAKMRRVWESQNAGAKLETRLFDAPHEFNATMQDEAFVWLEAQLKSAK